MDAPMPANKWPFRWRALGIGTLGYIAAVLAGSMMFYLQMMHSPSVTDWLDKLAFIIPPMAVFALPGWVALRLVLYWLKWTGLGALVFAGACNGWIGILFFGWVFFREWQLPDTRGALIFGLSGAVAGYVCWWAERALGRPKNLERPAE
jgi:hypothetical protein